MARNLTLSSTYALYALGRLPDAGRNSTRNTPNLAREIPRNWPKKYLKIGKIDTYFLYGHLGRLHNATTLVEITQEINLRGIPEKMKKKILSTGQQKY